MKLSPLYSTHIEQKTKWSHNLLRAGHPELVMSESYAYNGYRSLSRFFQQCSPILINNTVVGSEFESTLGATSTETTLMSPISSESGKHV